MDKMKFALALVLCCGLFLGNGTAYAQALPAHGANATLLTAGIEGGSGSAIGPEGALYVTEGATGKISRVDPKTGVVTTFASGLPTWVIGLGGAFDVAFVGDTAYALVTLVADDVGGSDVVGIYRIDGPDEFTIIADIGEFAAQHVPTNTFIDTPTGVQYALEPYRDGFLVTDGHHNRILQVTLDGDITEVIALDNTVPTGLALSGTTVYWAEAGPVPHLPEHGKVVSFGLQPPTGADESGADESGAEVSEVASGARLLVDVEFGPNHRLYALAQGDWAGEEAGTPAQPNTGALLAVNEDGTFTVIAGSLNQPTSLEFIGSTAYIVTGTGEVWTVDTQPACTLDTIKGAYVFQAVGVVVEEGEVLPYAEAGMWTLDGAGNAAGVISASVNGEPIFRGEAFTATYAISSASSSGCFYTVTADSGDELELYATPTGETMTYFSAGISGTHFRQ